MATRFYLPTTGAGNISPAYSTWTETTGANILTAVTAKISSANANKVQAHSATAANSTFLSRAYLSQALAAQTISAGTIKGTIRVLESAANDNLNAMRLVVRVVSADGTTFRSPVIYGPANGTVAEFATSLRAKRLATGSNTNAVTVSAGDRLFIEIGTTSTVGGTSLSDTISYGDDSGTDLGDNETDTNAYNPFVELSQNVVFMTVGSAAMTEAVDTISAAGKLSLSGILAVSEAADTISAAAKLIVTGSLAATEAEDSIASTATIATAELAASAALVEDGDAISATGTVALSAAAAVTEAADTVSATAKLIVSGTASLAESDDVPAATAALTISAAAPIAEAADSLTATATSGGEEVRYGAAALVEDGDTLSATFTVEGDIAAPAPAPDGGFPRRLRPKQRHRAGSYVHLAFVPRARVRVRRSQEAEILALAAAYYAQDEE